MKIYFLLFICLIIWTTSIGQVLKTEDLRIEQLSENIYQHISYLNIPNYGNYPCNGMVYMNHGEAIVFDTPVDSRATEELIDWIQNVQKKEIKAVVVTHFHIDCLGGLTEFHAKKIPSYANELTLELASKNKEEVLPEHGFKNELELKIGNTVILSKYFGKGHTYDNVVGYISSENALFGGCLIKEMGSGKGNLADASPTDWSATVYKISQTWPEIELVIPGHGKAGTAELLDYTIQLFR